jgi:hypothetical protein
MTDHLPTPGSTVRNWDLPSDGAGQFTTGLDRVAEAVWDGVQPWPAEIVMEGGPNIVVHSREEHDGIRAVMAQNARLAARDKP